jgi:hypothetical protein
MTDYGTPHEGNISVPAPFIAFKGPHDTDANMLRVAALKVEWEVPVGGSHVKEAIIKLLTDAADALDPWQPRTSRRWWCRACHTFTWWEFRGPEESGAEEERCGQCARVCPAGCGCKPGEADMRDCACDGPCVRDYNWHAPFGETRKVPAS